MNVQHSKIFGDWQTPSEYVEAARTVMGSIGLDPASSADANKTVRAGRYYDIAMNGLDQEWAGNVFLNPPGGLVREFWLKLVESTAVSQCVWVGFSIEQLQFLQQINAPRTPLDYSLCFPRKRIAFVKPGHTKSQPSHANYIAYLGDRRMTFAAVFSHFGSVRLFYYDR